MSFWTMAQRLIWVIAILALAWLYLRYFEWKNTFYPAREIEATPGDFGLAFEEVLFVAEDGVALHGWWVPHEEAKGTILHCHGNAGNIGDRAWMAADLHRLGVNVFLFDYRGYGRSRGFPSERGVYRDARAAYEVVRARHGDSESPPVIVHGQSLGGVVAVQLALDKPVRGLVVESAFSSVADIGEILYPWLPVRLTSANHFDALRKIAQIRVPKLFAHSPHDDLIPYALGRRLYDAAPAPKEFVDLEGGHNDAGWPTSPAYWRALDAWVCGVLR
jgi:fermentation-respiration switch protein FrsA (DUF1100 family)